MDVNEFLNEYNRMCRNYNMCKGCQFEDKSDCIDIYELKELIEEVESGNTFIVMQGKDDMNFCPNCGSLMKGGAE